MSYQEKDETRVAAGLKAAVHNPRVSDEAKDSAQERLQDMGAEVAPESEGTTTSTAGVAGRQTEGEQGTIEGKDAGNVLRGYKATLRNPNVSEEAKERAEDVLREHDAI